MLETCNISFRSNKKTYYLALLDAPYYICGRIRYWGSGKTSGIG